MRHPVFKIFNEKNTQMNILIDLSEDFNMKWKPDFQMNLFLSCAVLINGSPTKLHYVQTTASNWIILFF